MADTFGSLVNDMDAMIMDILGDTWLVDGHAVIGIFQDQPIESLGMVGTQPMLDCKTECVGFVRSGSIATKGDGVVYRVVPPIQSLGGGVTRLVLEQQ